MTASTPRIVDRLRRQADQRFVGREAELAHVKAALQQQPPPFSVLVVHGPGGIGKTAFTERVRSLAMEAGFATIRIDARDLASTTPNGLLHALCDALALEWDCEWSSARLLSQVLAAWSSHPRRMLVIDTFELLGPLEAWLRNHLLAELPESSLAILAGRQPPSRHWVNDPVWSTGLHVIGLRNLTPADCEQWLSGRSIDPALTDATLKLTYGHPLALTLLADVIHARGHVPDQLDADLIRQLTASLVSHVPSDMHRAALEACACARATTQGLLAEVVDADRAAELFEWLTGLGFVEAGPLGLFPHDLVRDAVVAELNWRHRPRFIELIRRLRNHCVRRMAGATGADRTAAALDILFMQRLSSTMRRFVDFSAIGTTYFDPARDSDLDVIAAMARSQFGPETQATARRWFGHPAARFWVARDDHQRVRGASFFVDVTQLSEAELAQTPSLKYTADWVARHAPVRPGEQVLCSPFIVTDTDVQVPSAAMNTMQMCMVFHWLTLPKLAVFVVTTDDPVYWTPMMRHIDFHLIDTPPVRLDEHAGGLFLHDWRAVPPDRWLNIVTLRAQQAEEAAALDLGRPDADTEPLVMLSQSLFEKAVKDALRQFGDPSLLSGNPLARSRLVQAARGPQESAGHALERLLRQAVAALGEHPRNAKFQRALELTYLQPVGSQELAAERLGLAFSTYRYQLTTGIDKVASWLWRQETAAFV